MKPVQCGPSQGSHSHAHVVATEPGKVWCSSCRASPALGCFLCSVSGTFLVPHHSHVSLWHFRSCSQFSCAVGFIAHQLCTLVVSTSCAHHHIFIVLSWAQCAKALWCIFLSWFIHLFQALLMHKHHFILMHSVLHWSPTDSSSFLKHNESRYSVGIAMIYYGLVIILTIHLFVLCWSTICQGIVCWMTFVGQCTSLDVTIVTTWPSMFAVLIFIWAAWCLMHGVTYYPDLYELNIVV